MEFLTTFKPILFEFLEGQIAVWDEYFSERVDAILTSRNRLAARVVDLEQAMERLKARCADVDQRVAKVTERECTVGVNERRLAEELAKIQAIRDSLVALLDGSRQQS